MSPCFIVIYVKISIHALLAESDARNTSIAGRITSFLSTLSLRRATPTATGNNKDNIFLSTLSLRRATLQKHLYLSYYKNFYPRSPCGERPGAGVGLYLVTEISIHALLAESDAVKSKKGVETIVISIHALLAESDEEITDILKRVINFYPRSPCGERQILHVHLAKECLISIHALLAESDECSRDAYSRGDNFYPRSPCGERLAGDPPPIRKYSISIHALLAESDAKCKKIIKQQKNFYPRSPCGERPIAGRITSNGTKFLSTLSLRRATVAPLLAISGPRYFYPRSPCGERPAGGAFCYLDNIISIHALLAESDVTDTVKFADSVLFLSTLSLRRATKYVYVWYTILVNFYPRSPCGERLHLFASSGVDFAISIHALLAESDQVCICVVYYTCKFLSTLSLRRATENTLSKAINRSISIHALLAESDRTQSASLSL